MKADHLQKGEKAESLAANALIAAGLTILAKNVNTRFGEIDIICRSKSELVFVEVRYRSNQHFGSAAASVSRTKQLKVINSANIFLQNNPKLNNLMMRFDVIGIDATNQLEWLKGAFLANT